MQKLHILPSVFVNLDDNEKAFVVASTQIRIDAEKAEVKKMKKLSKR